MTKIEKLKDVPPGAWAVLCALIVSCAAIVAWAPDAMWAALEKADAGHIAGVIGLVGIALATAVGRIVAAYRHATTAPPEPPVDPLDDVPTTPLGPPRLRAARRDREGRALPHALLGVAVLTGIIALCALLNGCGASPVRIHATVASTAGATIDEWCQAEREARDVAQRAAEQAHEYQEDAAAAVAAVRASYEPTIGGCGAAKGIHDAWFQAVALGAAGAPFDPVDVALRFVGPFVGVWSGLARASAGGEHPLDPPPSEVVDLAALAEQVSQ